MEYNQRFVSILLLLVFTGCFTRAYAQYTSTIHCLFSPAWEGKQVMLVANVLSQQPVIVDAIVSNRKVDFTITLPEPSPAYIWREGVKNDFQLFIDAPAIYVSFDQETFVTGSPSSETWTEQLAFLHTTQTSGDDLRMEASRAQQNGDSLAAYRLEQLNDSLQTARDEQIARTILDHPTLASSWFIFASNHFAYAKALQLFTKLSAFSSYPSYRRIQAKLASKQPGKPIKDFTLPAVTGPDLTLSALTSKYILIDLSSSFFVECRNRHKALKQIYTTFHPLGLEIVTVSSEFNLVEARKELRKENLPWKHVIDLVELMVTEKRPDSILVDADKVVVGRDLSLR